VKALSHEVLRLKSAAEFQGLSKGAAGLVGGRSDMDHLLAAKDQEMRAIAAERDRLRSECAKYQERCDAIKRTADALREEREKNTYVIVFGFCFLLAFEICSRRIYV
jgi:hypothetical protein